MASLRILVPESTSNYITNPALRYDTTGWSAFNATLTRVLTYARFGVASLQVVTNGTALNEGAYFRVNSLAGINDNITVSAYVRGAGKVRIRLIDQFKGSQWFSDPIALTNARWTRIEVSGNNVGSNDVRLYVESAGNAAQAITFYVDGAQMERKEYSTSYCDGNQPGCRWNLVDNGSISTRDPYTRAGGRWVALAGTCRKDNDIYATVIGGAGMPPIHNNIQAFAETPGSYYQNTKIDNRVMTITFHTKNKNLDVNLNPSLRRLHELRQQLIDLVKPDKTSGGEAFTLEYTDGEVPIYLDVRYEAGLEATWDIRNSWVNSFPVRFLAVSPMAYEDDQEVAILDFQKTLPGNTQKAVRVDGVWNNLNYSTDGTLRRFVKGQKGEVYAVGTFNYINNNANAISPLVPAGGRAKWDGTQWNTVGGAAIVPAGAAITDLAISPGGIIYVTGNFTSIGGVAANRVAFFDGANWNAMGTGLNSTGYAIDVAPNGDVYVLGIFTTAGGLSASGVARWDGSWHKVGQLGGLSPLNTNSSYDIAISLDGTEVYFAGDFTKELSGTAGMMNRVAKLTVSTNSFSQVGSGLNGLVNALALTKSGILYAGGTFTATVTPNVVTPVNNIAVFNGNEWSQLGNGKTQNVTAMALDENENLYVGGTYVYLSQTTDIDILSLWNGSSFVNLDVHTSTLNVGANGQVDSLYIGPFGDLYMAMVTISLPPLIVSDITLVTNIGSSEVSPVIYISGPGTVRWIENQTTQKRLYLDLYVLNNEEVFIDFSKGKIYSALRGDLFYGISSGSDFRSWSLTPGENKICAFMFNDVNAKMQLSYIPQHWSIDATARGEEMF